MVTRKRTVAEMVRLANSLNVERFKDRDNMDSAEYQRRAGVIMGLAYAMGDGDVREEALRRWVREGDSKVLMTLTTEIPDELVKKFKASFQECVDRARSKRP